MKTGIENNQLLIDNISEAIYEIEGENYESQSMLVCHVKHGDINYQVHIVVTKNEDDFIEDIEQMPELKYSDGNLYLLP